MILIVGLVILVAVVYAATGRGGGMPAERADYAPLDLGPVSATDIALHRPPSAAWGYDMQATDEALGRIADSVRERDVRIVALEQLVTDLSRDPAPVPIGDPIPGARHRRAFAAPGNQAPGIQAPGNRAPATTEAERAAERTEAPSRNAPPARLDFPPVAEAPTVDMPAIRPPFPDAPADAPGAGQSLAAAPVPDPFRVRERGGQPERQRPERRPEAERRPQTERRPQPEWRPRPERWQPRPEQQPDPQPPQPGSEPGQQEHQPPERSHD